MNNKEPNLHVTDESYRKFFKKLNTPTYVWKKKEDDLILINYNEAADNIVNNNMKEFLGKKASILYKDEPEILNDLKQSINGEIITPRVLEYKYKSVDLVRILYVSYSFIPPDLVFVHTDDISKQEEWKISEKTLIESEEKYRNLFENYPYIIALLDEKGKVLDLNSRAEQLLGFKKEELIGRNYLDMGMFDRSLLPELRARFERFSVGEKVEPYEVLIKTKEGKDVWLLSHMNPITISDNHYSLAVVLNITEKKKAEIKIEESEKMYREAYNRAEFYKDLFAHDINNILQNIRSANELRQIFENSSNDERKLIEVGEIITAQVIRGANLVSNIRKSSLLEEFSRKIKPIQFNLLLESAITFIEKMFLERDVRIRVHPFKDKLEIKGNEFILDVFENILINAIKYNKNPTIRIDILINDIKEDGISYVKFQFIDNGLGIQDKRKEIIFQRGQEKLPIEGGMGLGLSLVKKILEIYSGKIRVEDRIKGDYTQGSNFIILIPEATDNN